MCLLNEKRFDISFSLKKHFQKDIVYDMGQIKSLPIFTLIKILGVVYGPFGAGQSVEPVAFNLSADSTASFRQCEPCEVW
jgi:hypothetical protein